MNLNRLLIFLSLIFFIIFLISDIESSVTSVSDSSPLSLLFDYIPFLILGSFLGALSYYISNRRKE